MCIYVCEYGVRTPVCVGVHVCVCVCFQKPEEDIVCPVLSFFAVLFLSDWEFLTRSGALMVTSKPQ